LFNAPRPENLQNPAIPGWVDHPLPRRYDASVILVIDNYDSFTYNLVQRIGELGRGDAIRVVRNDSLSPEQAADEIRPTHLIISPGPCTPNEAGESCNFIRHFHGLVPILGVCLGHQSIGQVFGGKVIRADRLMHGKTSDILHDDQGVFAGLPNPFTATRYHSLIVDTAELDKDFIETSWTADQRELMGIRSRTHPTEGVQFHPESFLTDVGHKLLENFLSL